MVKVPLNRSRKNRCSLRIANQIKSKTNATNISQGNARDSLCLSVSVSVSVPSSWLFQEVRTLRKRHAKPTSFPLFADVAQLQQLQHCQPVSVRAKCNENRTNCQTMFVKTITKQATKRRAMRSRGAAEQSGGQTFNREEHHKYTERKTVGVDVEADES